MKVARNGTGPEVFASVQGEGKSSGRPCVFFRLSHCNLYCTFCDTDYTWNWQGTRFRHARDQQPGYQKFEQAREIIELTPEQAATAIEAFGCRSLVLTGGEPLLQQAELTTLVAALRARHPSYWVEVETNGTLVPSDDFDALVDQYNVSPKLANSGVETRHRLRSDAFSWFSGKRKATFKFVVAEPGDVSEVLEYVGRFAIAPEAVWLMPEGSSSETLRARQRWLAELCVAHGFHLGDRLHIHLYENQRGK
jgi:7-carboxy-7-deazaguanine synthase